MVVILSKRWVQTRYWNFSNSVNLIVVENSVNSFLAEFDGEILKTSKCISDIMVWPLKILISFNFSFFSREKGWESVFGAMSRNSSMLSWALGRNGRNFFVGYL